MVINHILTGMILQEGKDSEVFFLEKFSVPKKRDIMNVMQWQKNTHTETQKASSEEKESMNVAAWMFAFWDCLVSMKLCAFSFLGGLGGVGSTKTAPPKKKPGVFMDNKETSSNQTPMDPVPFQNNSL